MWIVFDVLVARSLNSDEIRGINFAERGSCLNNLLETGLDL